MSRNLPMNRMMPYLRNRPQTERGKRRSRNASAHLERVYAEIKVLDGVGTSAEASEAMLLLGDISLRGLKLFSCERFFPGQKVAVVLSHPQHIYLRGRVMGCMDRPRKGRILSVRPFPYRVWVLFEFRSAEERIAVQNYVDQLEERVIAFSAPL